MYFGFHRLSIIDKSTHGDQPFIFENEERRVVMQCNGEIYNFEELIKEFDLKCAGHSDCEVILGLYLKFGVKKTIELLNGEFAVSIFEVSKSEDKLDLYLFRDQCGIRPLFYGQSDQQFGFCSEIKGLTTGLGTPSVK